LVSIEFKISLNYDVIKRNVKNILSFYTNFISKDVFKDYPEEFVVNIDFVEVNVNDIRELKEHWFVTNELRLFALMIKEKAPLKWGDDRETELIPIPIANILPPSMTNKDGRIIISQNALFDYIKGLVWSTSNVPGFTRSGLIIPKTTTDILRIENTMDSLVRISNIYSEKAIIHESIPDFWLPHLYYDKYLTADKIRETFDFGKLEKFDTKDKLDMFKTRISRNIYEHIHVDKGNCMWCMDNICMEGIAFIVLPCGCSGSVMHLHCFLENVLYTTMLKIVNTPRLLTDKNVRCEMCKKTWWRIEPQEGVWKFRALKNEKSIFYTVNDLINKSIFQLYNSILYDNLKSNPRTIDYLDFIEK
jgi:hypothetical protein